MTIRTRYGQKIEDNRRSGNVHYQRVGRKTHAKRQEHGGTKKMTLKKKNEADRNEHWVF